MRQVMAEHAPPRTSHSRTAQSPAPTEASTASPPAGRRNFTARTKALLANDREGLDVEIEVLRDRLAREGLAPRSDLNRD